MTWISPDVPQMTEDELYKLFEGVLPRSPMKVVDRNIYWWCSICSMHFWHDPECRMCLAGHWTKEDPGHGLRRELQ